MPEKLEAEATEAAAQVIRMAGGYVVARAVHAVAQLAIADHLKNGARSAEELAILTGTHAPSLYRLMRSMAAVGLFEEDGEQRFSLTSLGSALRSDAPGYARSAVRATGAQDMWRAFGEFLHTLKTGEPVLAKPIFQDLSAAPEQAAFLNETMMGYAGAEPQAVADAYDFSSIRTLVDVGGNTGNLLTTILRANPALRGVVYDLPHVASETRRIVAERGLAERCEVIGGSFFDAVPAGSDGYMLSHVVHDWPEEKCLTVLRNVRRVIPDGGKLLILEQVVPSGNEPHSSKFIDLILLTITGGRERTADEYAALLAKAGFRLTRIVPTRLEVSVIEAEPDPRS